MRSAVVVLGVVLGLAGAARPAAAFDAVLLPQHPLQADGARVHVLRLFLVEDAAVLTGVPAIRAAHGAVVGPAVPASTGGLSLRYRPPRVTAPSTDRLSVTWKGQTVQVEVALEPAGKAQLALSVSPDPLVLGKGATAQLKVRVRDASGRPTRAPLRIGASVGRVTAFQELAPGDYQATYTPPEDKYPQVAILAALSIADGGFAAVPLRLAAKVTVPGEGEPGGTMQIVVDGRTFGPQTIGPDGKFSIPIIIPPGSRAVGTSIDPLGNAHKREIDLKLPPFTRLLLAAVPPELPADGRARAEVVAFAVDPRGAPERTRAPPLTADRGTLSAPQPRGDGAWSWSYTAPASRGDGVVTLAAGETITRVTLRPAPPFQLAWTPPAEPIAAGDTQPQRIEVRVEDASGSPVTGARLTATLAGGRVLGVDEVGGGRYVIRVTAPKDPGRGTAALHVELGGLEPGPPRRVSLHPARAPAGQVAAEAWLDDDLGLPVAGAGVELTIPGGVERAVTDRFGTARIVFPRPTSRLYRVRAQPVALPGLEATLDHLQLGESSHTVASVMGRGVVESEAPSAWAALDAEVPLRPAAPVDLRVSAEPATVGRGETARVRIRLADRQGPMADAPILYQASGGRLDLLQPVRGGVAELRFTPPPDAEPGTRYLISVTDPKTRVTVFTEVTVK